MHITLPDIFNPEQSEKYRLIIRLQSDGFSFAMSGPENRGLFHYQEISCDEKISACENLKEFLFDNPFLVVPYKQLQVMICSSAFTFVPSILFEEKSKEAFFDFNFRQRPGICLSRPLRQLPVHVIFEMKKDIYEFLHRSLIQPQFIHHIAPLTGFFHQRIQLGNNHKMVINPHRDSMDIICFSSDELLLANNFTCRNTDDMVYYILFIWKQLKWDQLNDSAYITGRAELFDEIQKTLHKYLKNVIHFQFPIPHHFSGAGDKISIPSDILALLSCES